MPHWKCILCGEFNSRHTWTCRGCKASRTIKEHQILSGIGEIRKRLDLIGKLVQGQRIPIRSTLLDAETRKLCRQVSNLSLVISRDMNDKEPT